MPSPSARPLARCHMAHITGARASAGTSVWICEYPYRTMRANGPSVDCEGCPIWQELVIARMQAAALAEDEVMPARHRELLTA